jgi:hypothetical protein
MTHIDLEQCPLAPSQKSLLPTLLRPLQRAPRPQRPYLLHGTAAVGKSFLARRVAVEGGAYLNVALHSLEGLLASHSLASLTPDATVRWLDEMVSFAGASFVCIDGLEPLMALWSATRPTLVDTWFSDCSRKVFDRPVLVVARTDDFRQSSGRHGQAHWPQERRFSLVLTVQDQEVVARNWELDPVRAHASAHLLELLTPRLGG